MVSHKNMQKKMKVTQGCLPFIPQYVREESNSCPLFLAEGRLKVTVILSLPLGPEIGTDQMLVVLILPPRPCMTQLQVSLVILCSRLELSLLAGNTTNMVQSVCVSQEKLLNRGVFKKLVLLICQGNSFHQIPFDNISSY